MAKRTRSAIAKLTAGPEAGLYFVMHGVYYKPARLKQRTKELMTYVEDPDMLLNEMVFLKDDPLPDDPSIERREELGTGPDGETYSSVTFNGKHGIMKECVDIRKERGAFSLLVKEVCMFSILQHLQGQAVAKLLGFGFASAQGFFLVQSYEGLRISTPITYAVLDSAEKSLLRIHKEGWLLGDIQPSNFTVRKERVKITCLMHCEPLADYNRLDREGELHSLRLMLSCSQGTVRDKEDVAENGGAVTAGSKGDSLEQGQASTVQTSVDILEDCPKSVFPSSSTMAERASDCSTSGDIKQLMAPC